MTMLMTAATLLRWVVRIIVMTMTVVTAVLVAAHRLARDANVVRVTLLSRKITTDHARRFDAIVVMSHLPARGNTLLLLRTIEKKIIAVATNISRNHDGNSSSRKRNSNSHVANSIINIHSQLMNFRIKNSDHRIHPRSLQKWLNCNQVILTCGDGQQIHHVRTMTIPVRVRLSGQAGHLHLKHRVLGRLV